MILCANRLALPAPLWSLTASSVRCQLYVSWGAFTGFHVAEGVQKLSIPWPAKKMVVLMSPNLFFHCFDAGLSESYSCDSFA